jgi:hypothetical protein
MMQAMRPASWKYVLRSGEARKVHPRRRPAIWPIQLKLSLSNLYPGPQVTAAVSGGLPKARTVTSAQRPHQNAWQGSAKLGKDTNSKRRYKLAPKIDIRKEN